jgi:hypothetical protein
VLTLSNSLADEILEHAQAKVCKVNHIKDFFPDLPSYDNPLSEDQILANGEDKYYLPVSI